MGHELGPSNLDLDMYSPPASVFETLVAQICIKRFKGSSAVQDKFKQTLFLRISFVREVEKCDMIPTGFKFSYKSNSNPRFTNHVAVVIRIKFRYAIKQKVLAPPLSFYTYWKDW